MTKGCYTCRRRRIICDNALPTCQKCRDAGKECLGYQKPLVWVKGGVASRGKMMGRSFNDTTKKSARRTGNSNGSTAVSSDVLTASTINDNHHTGPGTPQIATIHDDAPVAPVVQSSYRTVQPEKNNASSSSSDNATVTEQTPLPFGLIDPTLKDMNELSRFYIFHFNQKTADDFVLYTNTQNPYRGLISLVGESPLLANALSATGAVHYALLSNSDFSPMPWSSGDPMAAGAPLSAREIEKAIKSSMSRRPSSKVYEHFLGLKQRTLRQLSLDLRDPVKRNDDKTAAATMVLALMDAIESGEEAWKYHLEGAKKLLNNRQQKSDAGTSREIVGWLDSLTIDGCLLIELMGSTLARPGVLSKPFYTPSMGQTALKRLEKTYWVGCPAYLLEVIFFVHARFCHSGADPNAQQPTMVFSSSFLPKNSEPLKSPEAFLQHIQAFDPTAWAVELQTVLFLPDLTMRIALASTYKAAVYLYASRVISRPRLGSISVRPSWFGLPPDHDAVAQFLIQQLSVIPPRDQHFKCLIWPTFIAGAECRDASHRPFILDRLSTLYYAIATVNVRNAAWVLSMMWQKQDLKREQSGNRKWLEQGVDPALGPSPGFGFDPGPGHGTENVSHPPPYDDDDFDWIQELDESRIDWLFI